MHAATTASAGDTAGREALCKYILRPPIAQDRIQLVADDLVRLTLKKPFSDGTFAIDLDPLSFLARLATAVHPPRFNTVRYSGVLAAASKWRSRVVPPPPPIDEKADDDCATCTAKKDKPPTHRCGYRPWKALLRRSFKIDVELCECGGRMKIKALVMTSAGIDRYLRWLGEPTDPPTLAPPGARRSSRASSSAASSVSRCRRSCSPRIDARSRWQDPPAPAPRQPRASGQPAVNRR
ncbi:MAG: transposase [Myxococcales bacterium]|nr:transposase [Myxococcales bacterium]